MALSNPDLDGDGMLFESIYKYNGQEFDYEIGLYNYKARMYDQKAGRFLTTDPVLTENRGFDAYDPYGYVSGNPVNFTDPTGKTTVFEAMAGGIKWAAKGATGGMQWAAKGATGALRWASKGIDHSAREIMTGGAYTSNSGNDLGTPGRKLMEVGTFLGKMIHHPAYILGVLEGLIDYIVSFVTLKNPSVVYSRGSFGIRNSSFTNDGISYTSNGVVHFAPGDESRETFLHEFGHVDQFFTGGGNANSSHQLLQEIDADMRSGTMNYMATKYLLFKTLSPEAFKAMALYSTVNQPLNYIYYNLSGSAYGRQILEQILLLGFGGNYYTKEMVENNRTFLGL